MIKVDVLVLALAGFPEVGASAVRFRASLQPPSLRERPEESAVFGKIKFDQDKRVASGCQLFGFKAPVGFGAAHDAFEFDTGYVSAPQLSLSH